MTKKLLILSILLIAQPAFAQMGSVKSAMFIVDGFFDESMYLMRDLERDDTLRSVTLEMRRRKDDTITALRTMRWIESPSRERYDKIYSIVETYGDEQIASVNKLKDTHNARTIELMVRQLKDLKNQKLKALAGTKKYETYRGKPLRPVPIIDKSPFESGGKTGTGGEIWFR